MMNGPWTFIHPAEGFAEQELCTDTKISERGEKRARSKEMERMDERRGSGEKKNNVCC